MFTRKNKNPPTGTRPPPPLAQPTMQNRKTLKGLDLMSIKDWPNLLVTADHWFRGPDGAQYRAAYGPADIIPTKNLLGFDPKNSTNWVMAIGFPGNQLILMGCQIHYVMMCPKKPTVLNDILDLSEEK